MRAGLILALIVLSIPLSVVASYEAAWRDILSQYFSDRQVEFILKHWADKDRVYFIVDKYGRIWMVGQGYIPLQPVPVAKAVTYCDDQAAMIDVGSEVYVKHLNYAYAYGVVNDYLSTNPTISLKGAYTDNYTVVRQGNLPLFDIILEEKASDDSIYVGAYAEMNIKQAEIIFESVNNDLKVNFSIVVYMYAKAYNEFPQSDPTYFYFRPLKIFTKYYSGGAWFQVVDNITVLRFNMTRLSAADLDGGGYIIEDTTSDGKPDLFYIDLQIVLNTGDEREVVYKIEGSVLLDLVQCSWSASITKTETYNDPTSQAGNATLTSCSASTAGHEPISVNAVVGAQAGSTQTMILFENPFFNWSVFNLSWPDPNIDKLYKVWVGWGWTPQQPSACDLSVIEYEMYLSEYSWSMTLPQYMNAEALRNDIFLPEAAGQYYFVYAVVVEPDPSQKYIYFYYTPVPIDVLEAQARNPLIAALWKAFAPVVGALKKGVGAAISFAWDLLPTELQNVLKFMKNLLVDVVVGLIDAVSGFPLILDIVKLLVVMLPIIVVAIAIHDPFSVIDFFKRIVQLIASIVQAIRAALPLP